MGKEAWGEVCNLDGEGYVMKQIEDKTKFKRTADVIYAAIERAMAYENFTERTAMVIDDEYLEQAVFTAP